MMHLSLGKRFLRTTISLSVLALLLSAAPAPAAAPEDDAAVRVTRLADEYVREYIARNPEMATFEGLPDAPDDKLSDNSLEALAAWQAKEDGWLARLAAIDGAALWGRPEWLTYGFLREALEASKGMRIARHRALAGEPDVRVAGGPGPAGEHPAGGHARRQAEGPRPLRPSAALPRYGDRQPQGRAEARLFDAEAERRARHSSSWTPSSRRRSRTPRSSCPPSGTGIPDSGRMGASASRTEITPAVRRYRDFLKNEYLPRARTSIAISAHPNGAEAYRALFRSMASSGQGRRRDLSPRRKGRSPVRSGGRGDRAEDLQGPGSRGRQEEDGGRSAEPFPDPRRAPGLHQGSRRPGPPGHAGMGRIHAQGRCRGRAHPRLSREDRVERLPVGNPRREPSRRLHDQPLQAGGTVKGAGRAHGLP